MVDPLVSLERLDEADAASERAVALYRQVGDERGLRGSLAKLGDARRRQKDYAGAVVPLEEALELDRKAGDQQAETRNVSLLGMVKEKCAGDLDGALAAYRAGIEIDVATNDIGAEAFDRNRIVQVLRGAGRSPEAIPELERLVDLWRQLGKSDDERVALNLLGESRLATGDHAGALAA